MSYFEQRRTVVRGESETLKVFLMSRLQPWRWPIMLANGGIRVERGGKPVPDVTLGYQLFAGDVVVTDDAYGITWMQLIREATRSHRDYIYSPNRGADSFLNNQHDVLMRDPRAFDVSHIKHLKELVESLTLLGQHPIRHLILVGHANPFGDITMPMRQAKDEDRLKDPNAHNMNWESLKEAIAESSLLIQGKPDARPNPIVTPRPQNASGKFIPFAVIIRGCNSGKHTNLLAKIREALGKTVDMVIMPKFFNAADFIGRRSPTQYAAAIEYFMHDFTVTSKTSLNRAAVLEALKKRQYSDWLGTRMPDDWSSLVPRAFGDSSGPTPVQNLTVRVPGRERPAVFTTRFESEPITTNTVIVRQAAEPDQAAMRDAVLKAWQPKPFFTDAQWPVWKRLGLDTADELMDWFAYRLDAAVKRKPGEWHVQGVRFSYTVRTPLVEGETLYCNYYPEGEKSAKNVETRSIDYNDDRVFGRANFIPATFARKV